MMSLSGVAVVVGMPDDLGGVDELLGVLIDGNVVLTKTHLDVAAGQHQSQSERTLGERTSGRQFLKNDDGLNLYKQPFVVNQINNLLAL